MPLPVALRWDFIQGLEGATAEAGAAPPGPRLHDPELDCSVLRIYTVRKGARATLKTERRAGHLASCEDHVREGKRLGCLPLGVSEKEALSLPHCPGREPTGA